MGQIFVQLVEIFPDGLPVFCGCVCLHDLNMVSVVVPPSAHLPVHVLDFPVMGFDQLLLVVRNPFICSC